MNTPRWKLPGLRASLSVAVTLLVLLALAGMAVAYVAHKHRWAQDLLAQIEPRHARLLGLRAAGPELEAQLAQARRELERLAYAAAVDATQAGNDAQQRVRRVLEQAGLQVLSSQVLPAVEDQGLDRIPLALRVDGPLAALQAALAGLAAEAPIVAVDSMTVQTIGAVRAGQVPDRLSVQLVLSVMRARG